MNFVQKAALKIANISLDEYNRRFIAGDDIHEDSEIDTDTALKYSAVFACCRVLAETFASVPIILYKKNGNEREAVTDLQIYDVLHNAPNDEMSHFNFSEAMMMGLNTNGNAIAQKLFNSRGEIVQLYPIRAEIKRDEQTKRLIYVVKDGTKERVFQRSEVFHVPGPSLDGINGLSPISYASASIRLGLSYENFGIHFYKNAANPSGAFSSDTTLSEVAYNRLKESLKNEYTGLKNTGTPLLLEDGLKWLQFTINPVDAQLLESKNFQIEDICRIYRVPQHLVNKLDRSTFSNIEQQALEFVVYTMLPHFKRYEECVNSQLLTLEQRKQGYYAQHKVDGLLRGDSAARSAFYASGRQWGWLCVNDIRRLENMPPVEGGNIYLQPTNMIEAGTQNNTINAKVLHEIENILNERSKTN